MFTVHCPHHGATMLLGSSRIEAIENTPAGPVVHWRCRCGTRGRLATGRPPATRASR